MSKYDDGFDAFMHKLGFSKVERTGNTFPPPPPKKNPSNPFLNMEDFLRFMKDLDAPEGNPATQDNSECPGCSLCDPEDEYRSFEDEDLAINEGNPNDCAVINVSAEGQSSHDFVQFANMILKDLVKEYQSRGANLVANIVVNTTTEIRH